MVSKLNHQYTWRNDAIDEEKYRESLDEMSKVVENMQKALMKDPLYHFINFKSLKVSYDAEEKKISYCYEEKKVEGEK